MRTAKLDEIVRQKDPALKSAVELLATGQTATAVDLLQQQGRIREIPNAEERIRTIARDYVESPEKTLIVSPDNASRRALNIAVREELKVEWRRWRRGLELPRSRATSGHDWRGPHMGESVRNRRCCKVLAW